MMRMEEEEEEEEKRKKMLVEGGLTSEVKIVFGFSKGQLTYEPLYPSVALVGWFVIFNIRGREVAFHAPISAHSFCHELQKN